MITQTYKLNLMPGAEHTWRNMFPPKVNVSQFDKGLRTIVFVLYEQDGKFTIPAGAVAYIFGMKNDGNAFEYQMIISEDRHEVSVLTQQQMTVLAGDFPCEVILYESAQSTNQIGTANFTLHVEEAAVGDDAEFSESDMPIIRKILFDGEPDDVLVKTAQGVNWSSEVPEVYMRKSVYDTDNDGIVDNAEKVNGHSVARDVLAGEYTNSQIDSGFQTVNSAISALDSVAVKKVNNVTPVNGAVTLTKSNIGLGNVDNTSDQDKPISTATQTALNLKANDADLKAVAKSGKSSDVSYVNTSSGLSAANVQAAIDEVAAGTQALLSVEQKLSGGYLVTEYYEVS